MSAVVLPGRAAVHAAAPSRLHLTSWDRLRVIAALDTVALHLGGQHAIFGFGLPLFLILSIALGVSKTEARPTGRFLSRRVERILVPWAFWSVVIVGLRCLYEVREGDPAFGWAEPTMLLYGPRIHLWFLPFILGAGLAAHLFHRVVRRSRLAVLAAVLASGALLLVPPLLSLPWPFQQWVFSLPAIPLGFALGRALAFERSLARLRLLLGAGLVTFLGLGLIAWAMDPRAGLYAFRFAGGLGLLVVATFLPNRADRWTAHFTPLMLGVYILHPVVYLWLVKPLMCAVELNHVLWLRVVLAFPATMLSVWALRKVPFFRRVL
ncbi:MAG TPA: acyltransferase [Sandaracinaceae bacterium LLY-WYZ-13_1]|nr:acyltransferase [Sandaracinaceae bacterium LLY-WYZ-13_1]